MPSAEGIAAAELANAVIYLTLNPLAAMLLGMLKLGEAVMLALGAGLACVIAGILIANLRPPERARTPVREGA